MEMGVFAGDVIQNGHVIKERLAALCFSAPHPKSVMLSGGSRFCGPQPKHPPNSLHYFN